MPKISVIVPVYKVEEYLDRCVESVLAQTFTDFELILVDDGSPDNCPQICDAWADKNKKIKVIHKVNGGLSSARNAGIEWSFENSNSKYICFIDSDDIIHPQFLEHLYNAIQSSNTLVSSGEIIPFCNEKEIDNGNIAQQMQILPFSEYYSNRQFFSVSVCIKLYKKELFKTVRFPVGKLMEDAYVTYKVLYNAGNIAVTHSAKYFYYLRQDSIMHKKYSLKMLDGLDACKEQLEFFEELNDKINSQTAYTQLIHAYAGHCKQMSANKEFDNIRKKLIIELRMLLKDKRYKVAKPADCPALEVAFPKRMWVYWTLQGIKNKVKKKQVK